jgi:hypothetical protein
MGLEIPQTLQSTNISLFGRQPRSTYTKRAARSFLCFRYKQTKIVLVISLIKFYFLNLLIIFYVFITNNIENYF